ncbi:hypothetical protein D3C85_346200 [compost metagenome]
MPDECILWAGCKSTTGYGLVRHNGKCARAHRVAYCRYNGLSLSDIGGLCVMHTCDTPSCVNPDHLRLGTHKDNMSDKVSKGRNVQVKGEEQGSSKLTDEAVREILDLYVKSHREYGASALSRLYGVHPSTVNRIVAGNSWAHITSDDRSKEGTTT